MIYYIFTYGILIYTNETRNNIIKNNKTFICFIIVVY